MPLLVLLNGGPASGKSTLAHLWAEERPFALSLDLDVLRAMIADWESHPVEAGLRTRDLAVTLISDHLAHGYDVIVPQFLLNAAFADRLGRTAATVGAQYIEAVLIEDYDVAERRFSARAERAELSDEARTVHGPLGASMEEVFERHREFIHNRTHVVRVMPVDGDLDTSLDRLKAAIDSHGASVNAENPGRRDPGRRG